jgi:hypothetical protein
MEGDLITPTAPKNWSNKGGMSASPTINRHLQQNKNTVGIRVPDAVRRLGKAAATLLATNP